MLLHIFVLYHYEKFIIIINDIPHYYLYKILSIYPLNLLKKLYKKINTNNINYYNY